MFHKFRGKTVQHQTVKFVLLLASWHRILCRMVCCLRKPVCSCWWSKPFCCAVPTKGADHMQTESSLTKLLRQIRRYSLETPRYALTSTRMKNQRCLFFNSRIAFPNFQVAIEEVFVLDTAPKPLTLNVYLGWGFRVPSFPTSTHRELLFPPLGSS